MRFVDLVARYSCGAARVFSARLHRRPSGTRRAIAWRAAAAVEPRLRSTSDRQSCMLAGCNRRRLPIKCEAPMKKLRRRSGRPSGITAGASSTRAYYACSRQYRMSPAASRWIPTAVVSHCRNGLSRPDQGAVTGPALLRDETAKRQDIDPKPHLSDILSKLVKGWPMAKIDELLPWAWAQHSKARLAA